MTESFADAPPTITELRSDRTGKSRDWTPRDLLISLLRDIDNGKISPTNMFVSYSWMMDGLLCSKRTIAGPATTNELVGALSYEIHRLHTDP